MEWARSVLTRAEKDQGAGLDHGNPLRFEQLLESRILRAGIEDDPPGFQAEDIIRDIGLETRPDVESHSMNIWNRGLTGHNGDRADGPGTAAHRNDLMMMFHQHPYRLVGVSLLVLTRAQYQSLHRMDNYPESGSRWKRFQS